MKRLKTDHQIVKMHVLKNFKLAEQNVCGLLILFIGDFFNTQSNMLISNCLSGDFLISICLVCIGGPRYLRSFYLQIHISILKIMVQNDNFQSKMDFLSENSRFDVQNDGTYLPKITRETCI
jgi:hypothetical protein